MSRHAFVPILAGAALWAGAFFPIGDAHAATRVVTQCGDSGAGSLRNAITSAISGDVIDMRALSCTRIVLTSGELVVPQASLTLLGPGRDALTIDGRQTFRVFRHTGDGLFRLENATVAWGYHHAVDELGRGGCISSNGSVQLHLTRVHHCQNLADGWLDSPPTAGGAISALRHVTLSHSSVFDSIATTNSEGGGVHAEWTVTLQNSHVFNNSAWVGGGVYAGSSVNVVYSTIRDNRGGREGGGVYMDRGNLLVNKSTISNNRLHQDPPRSIWPAGGGIRTRGNGTHTIVDSTLSGNHAAFGFAAYLEGVTTIHNSTIAFNVGLWDDDPPTPPCEDRGALWSNALTLYSTILANTTCTNGVGYDLGTDAPAIVGFGNLITRSNVAVPGTTITADPRLAPLALNGGPSRTHMPLADSPAIDRGYNVNERAYDQRGPGFPRIKGPRPDIGAVER
ncbi:right-handed parallel beta-helix repeat-containing protein [Lysobacter arvi]|uniref:Right-handed parallel beta-helix repeat-containing protein n=1 Tax=Lysobacter arvi TaxID=3038776 RepID=A0ABU1CA28_9GAMM|nr:right-handed parallel beta-helix repeat-containing protein [Lysobacter arvi]MDR0182043.1 right-handed parallel beta-helix repeat-containing protein [Lysobacter arvi]